MKCTNRRHGAVAFCLLAVMSCLLSGCGNLAYDMVYSADSNISSFNVISGQDTGTAVPFAANLCVVAENVSEGTEADLSKATAALLFSLEDNRVIYAKNAHDTLNPASLTKVMTALVVLKYGRLDQKLTASNAVNITESGAVLCGLKTGDTMTMDQALRILLIYSANDAAMLIAEGVGGSVDNFVAMMNEEAARLGATNTHFTNPHGLTDPNHYTTAYDLYLIFNEAIKYEAFNEIIHMASYQTVYYDKNGKEKEFDRSTTNQFLKVGSDYHAPSGVTVIGGKTGTTKAAGHCLMLSVRDVNGSRYIAVTMGVPSTQELYVTMADLLEEIQK
ncbi:MAG: D-alanyl-D-alanine carboxypeptidase [Butyrivibrio sp.]|nr:D-alanyl-D-alanine carboxypeptidase [Acetatifactor muris]MCM1557950.1 D-alanyl-D-alanine carboxypeptidase [Butyrivibrio sp.]